MAVSARGVPHPQVVPWRSALPIVTPAPYRLPAPLTLRPAAQAVLFSLGLATTLAGLGVVSTSLGQAYGQIGELRGRVAAGCVGGVKVWHAAAQPAATGGRQLVLVCACSLPFCFQLSPFPALSR